MNQASVLFGKIAALIEETNFSGHEMQYPPLFSWRRVSAKNIYVSWKKSLKKHPNYLGLYVHIPFCAKRCEYCRYYSVALDKKYSMDAYLGALFKEMELLRPFFKRFAFSTIYIGGGTPALLGAAQLESLFSTIYKNFNFLFKKQITFEGSVDFLDFDKLRVLKKYGVDRLTIGVQSLDQKVIDAVGRFQTNDLFEPTFKNARKAGIKYINIDVMAGLPGQTLKSATKTLSRVLRLRPDMVHVNKFYPNAFCGFTKKGLRLDKKDLLLRERISDATKDMILAKGYRPTEFDADALGAGADNRQLSNAISADSSFLGIGAGAVSHAAFASRYINEPDIQKYIDKIIKHKQLPIWRGILLTKKDEMIYFVTASLRYGKVSKRKFFALFKRRIKNVFRREIALLIDMGKLAEFRDNIFLRPGGSDSYDEYAILSKVFYDKSLLRRCQKSMP